MGPIEFLVPVTTERPAVHPPVNKCIYCGDISSRLTREHVMAIGLGGGLILPKASCPACQKEIEKVETTSMRGMLLDYRREFDLVRHGNEMPTTAALRIGGPQGEARVVPFEDAPRFLLIPKPLNWPGILSGEPAGAKLNYEMVVLGNRRAFAESAKKFGGDVAAERLINLDAYFRMIAKIAHGFAVARRGLDSFCPFLPDFILGKYPGLLPFLIGETPWTKTEAIEGRLSHQMLLTNLAWKGQNFLLARIWLFAAHNPPAYTVVVGTLI